MKILFGGTNIQMLDIKRTLCENDSVRKALLTQPDIDGFVVTEANMSYNFIASIVGQSLNSDNEQENNQSCDNVLLVDAENNVLGTEKRSVIKANPKSMWHRNSVIFISTPKGFLV